MKKDINQIRRDIAKRKKEKTLASNPQAPKRYTDAMFPQEEEKHGYMPTPTGSGSTSNLKDTFVASFVMKLILSAVLFFGVAIFFRVDNTSLQAPKQWTSQALTEEFPFATVNQWYQQKFGFPLALTPNQTKDETEKEQLALPVNGTISQTFQMNGQGIMISSDKKTDVLSMESGIVIFAGNDPKTDKTVIIQHPDHSNTIYGNLSSINVHQYQLISSNQTIGEYDPATSKAKTVYFAIEKDNQFLDPVKVMQVDERP
ncbi:M23 family metallopeptidase [Aquibacillus kalidii]|uniref:M23 family metallopeptidase n=1 Tax=Aquibacillus kalidii TaxID=2762597 RepID=UPI001646C83D|nr:M23 family metallopeptidase [Aquibacillus kalidii]